MIKGEIIGRILGSLQHMTAIIIHKDFLYLKEKDTLINLIESLNKF